MQVQNICKVCPVCKAGVAEDKVRPRRVTASHQCRVCFCQACSNGLPKAFTANIVGFTGPDADNTLHQVVPIYGRGGVQEDPRGKQKPVLKEHHQHNSVPRRPAGQRLAPTDVSLWPCLHGAMLLNPALTACLDSTEGHSCTAYWQCKYAARARHHTNAAGSEQ